jgi:hypothetical protein
MIEDKKNNEVYKWLAAALLWVFLLFGASKTGDWLTNIGIGVALSYLILYRDTKIIEENIRKLLEQIGEGEEKIEKKLKIKKILSKIKK